MYKIEVKDEPTKKVLSIRTTLSMQELPIKMPQIYKKIWDYIQEKKVKVGDVAFAAYYNDDMEKLDTEIGFTTLSSAEGKDEIKANEIPASKFVSTIHKGPYKNCPPAYEALIKWIKENGYTRGVAYEFYLNDPSVVPENELLTRIAFQLK